MTHTNEILLNVQGLSVDRAERLLLQGVTLEVRRGAAVILRGPNGLGKTTLMRVLAGLQKPIAGQVDLTEEGFVYCGHDNALKGQLTIGENLVFWRAVFGSKIEIQEALSAFNLTELEDRPAHYLSAGQKRRAGLARMIIADKPLWILDEPTVSLDSDSVRLFAAAVEAHLAAGGGAIMATHIDLGVSSASVVDLSQYRADPATSGGAFDEAFL